MTRDEAIKQLDWYFNEGDGLAADNKTRTAYILLRKRMVVDAIICPVCRDTMKWNGVIGRYRCPTCGTWDHDEDII